MELKEYTFRNLFGIHTDNEGNPFEIQEIEIPIIQRDYAQGRTFSNVQRIRNRFLEAIYDALTNHKRMTLDFVYGEIENKKFIPLDGQQRLTTLFLLHWYAAKKEHIKEEEYAFLYKFTYYTRPSSRDFCRTLIQYTPVFDNKLSEVIKDQPSFQYQWLNDPSITGMLVMIDAIQEKFDKVADLWGSLVVHPCLSFYFLPISQMGLTDELYVKMNSRGKPLTQFEHFKAEFEALIKDYNENLSKEINHKFDIKWTDMLFPYRGENQIIDDEFMRYFFYISDMLFYQQYPDRSLEQDEFVLAKMLYGSDCPNQKDNIEFLVKSFDCWCDFNIDEFFERHLAAYKYQSGKTKIYQNDLNILRQCCDTYREYEGRNRKFPLNMNLLLYAFVIYLHNKEKITESDFQRRLRIVRNLIWNSQFEIRADGQRNNMSQLLAETEAIILHETILDGVGYNKNQKEEEQKKLDWLKSYNEHSETLFHLEDHPLLYGCIAVLGLENIRNFDKFRNLFDDVSDKTLIHQALLIYDDYSQSAYTNTRYMGNNNDGTWKDLFHPSNRRGSFERTSNALNLLLDNLTECTDNGLKLQIDEYLAAPRQTFDWRYYFIKYKETLCGNWGILWYEAPYKWYTLRQSTFRGFNWQSLSRAIWQRAKDRFTMGNWAYMEYEPLYIANTQKKIIVKNSRFEIKENDTILQTINIPQNEDGMDIVDRIEYFLTQSL